MPYSAGTSVLGTSLAAGGGLAATGFATGWLLLTAITLLFIGGVLIQFARRSPALRP
jgi:hypothetical protein